MKTRHPNRFETPTPGTNVINNTTVLRQEAEKRAWSKQTKELDSLSPEEIEHIVHDLQVHQIELELQNEELLRVQIELDTERARYFDLYDLAPVGYLTLGKNGLIIEGNLTAASLLSVHRSALVHQPLSRFILHEDQDIYYRFTKRLHDSQHKGNISTAPVGADSPGINTLGENKGKSAGPQSCELRMVTNSRPPIWIRLEGSISDARNEPIARLVLIDISERKRAEQETLRLQAQLQHSRKMESVGRLAGGVAHDFNNMLGAILGYVEIALQRTDPSQIIYSDLCEIRKAAERSADLTRKLLTFARKQTVAPEVLNLNDTIDSMLGLLQRMIGEEISLTWQGGKDVWPVKVDPSQIDQILANLCVNARDAIGSIGQIDISTGTNVFNERNPPPQPEILPGEYVLISVSDNGCGMSKEVMLNLFEPFFTTKAVGKGTGLGLATVYGIVKQNLGFITVESEPCQGTTLKIYFPRFKGNADEQKKGSIVAKTHAEGHETILLVEDEPAILEVATRILERLGYTVLAAATPGEALRLANENAGDIDLLMTDVIMPEMNGRELAKKIRALFPHISQLFMSGYTNNVIARHGVLEEGVNFIQKPFTIKGLESKVREALGHDVSELKQS